MIDQNTNEHRENEHIVDNKELSIFAALVPVIALVAMLAYNVYVFGDDALSGSNQFILLLGGAVAAIVGFLNKVSYKQMIAEVEENIKSTTGALLILLMVHMVFFTLMDLNLLKLILIQVLLIPLLI